MYVGRLRGLILRKTLCSLLKYKAYSTPISATKNLDGGIPLAQAATFFYDTLEKNYPNYPDVRSIKLVDKEMVRHVCIHFLACLIFLVVGILSYHTHTLFELLLMLIELLVGYAHLHGSFSADFERGYVSPTMLQVRLTNQLPCLAWGSIRVT